MRQEILELRLLVGFLGTNISLLQIESLFANMLIKSQLTVLDTKNQLEKA